MPTACPREYTVTKFWSFPYIVSQTDLIAMIPIDFARLAARNFPIEVYPTPFDMPKQKVYMTWKKNRDNDPGHRWLRDQIINASQSSELGFSHAKKTTV